jgi:hypothetical protein
MVMTSFRTLFQYFVGKSEEIHEKPHSGCPVACPSFKPGK